MDVPVNLALKACCCSPKANLFLQDPGSWTGGYNFYQFGNGEVEREQIRQFKPYILLLNIVCDCINILLPMLTYLPVVYFCLFLHFIHDVFVYLLCPCDFSCDGEGLPTWWLSRANEQSKLLSVHSQQYKFNSNYLGFSKKKTPSIVPCVCLFIWPDNVYSENMLYKVFFLASTADSATAFNFPWQTCPQFFLSCQLENPPIQESL